MENFGELMVWVHEGRYCGALKSMAKNDTQAADKARPEPTEWGYPPHTAIRWPGGGAFEADAELEDAVEVLGVGEPRDQMGAEQGHRYGADDQPHRQPHVR